MYTTRDLVELLREIESHEAELTRAEETFVDSCKRTIAQRAPLAETTAERLETLLDVLDQRAGIEVSDDDTWDTAADWDPYDPDEEEEEEEEDHEEEEDWDDEWQDEYFD